jgi:hypothetical protein
MEIPMRQRALRVVLLPVLSFPIFRMAVRIARRYALLKRISGAMHSNGEKPVALASAHE